MKAFYVFLFGAIFFIVAGLLGTLVGDKAKFMLWMYDYRTTPTDYFFYYVTRLGEEYGYIAFGIYLWFQSWKKMLTVPILGGVVTLVTFLLKQYFQHERPVLYLNEMGWNNPMSVLGYHIITGLSSFPSGHSMAIWALCTLMAVLIKRGWFSVICVFIGVCVSLSRVYLMVHFLEDVVAGAMVGIALGYGVYYAY
ncbi:MAG: phosphatase PAP2 family protein, partial [Bacteroidota bacterium]|nr:phosphatase PAP2 family protein [Bacteroidota bacterium]